MGNGSRRAETHESPARRCRSPFSNIVRRPASGRAKPAVGAGRCEHQVTGLGYANLDVDAAVSAIGTVAAGRGAPSASTSPVGRGMHMCPVYQGRGTVLQMTVLMACRRALEDAGRRTTIACFRTRPGRNPRPYRSGWSKSLRAPGSSRGVIPPMSTGFRRSFVAASYARRLPAMCLVSRSLIFATADPHTRRLAQRRYERRGVPR